MPIVVGHDFNPGLLPYEAAYMMQQQALGQQAAQGQGALQAQAAATNARLRPQGGGSDLMARHNASQAEQGAGFDWQTPIQLMHPDNSYDTLYQSQGADPMARQGGNPNASPGFGMLGSREQIVRDNSNVINPNDPLDRAKVGRLQNLPNGNNYVNADFFRSPEELKDREQAKANDEWDRRQQFEENLRAGRVDKVAQRATEKAGNQPFGVTKEGDALDKQYAKDMDVYHRGESEESSAEASSPLKRVPIDGQADEFVEKATNKSYEPEIKAQRDALLGQLVDGLKHPASEDPQVRATFTESINKELQKLDVANAHLQAQRANEKAQQDALERRQQERQNEERAKEKRTQEEREQRDTAHAIAIETRQEKTEQRKEHRDRTAKNWEKASDAADRKNLSGPEREAYIKSKFEELQAGNPRPEGERNDAGIQKVLSKPVSQLSPFEQRGLMSHLQELAQQGASADDMRQSVAQMLGAQSA